ncbi:MAG: suppressor of fused domain protein [Planctomycetota bacterium]|jgi:hypothetical protein
MNDWLRKLWPFGKKKEFSDDRMEEHYEAKKAAMEAILGPLHEIVGHALIPFCLGGGVDMYYFCECMPGTVFVTMEMISPDGKGPKSNKMGTYELVTCTRLAMPPVEPHEVRKQKIKDGTLSDFDIIDSRMCGIMTTIGNYGFHAVIEPGETAELPGEDENEINYLVFDEFDRKGVPFIVEDRKHGLLLCIEVFRSELDYARKSGSAALLAKLKEAGFYPYSDLDRKAVV